MYEIVTVRTVMADDGAHRHVELVGYQSPHMPGEPIMIEIPRVLQKIAFGEKFWVVVDGEQYEVSAGKCPVCGHEPSLKTAADKGTSSVLVTLPER